MKFKAITQFILKHKNHFWLLVAIAVAFALRVYALSVQSLWVDEGTSVALAPLSLEAIATSAAKDIHPPLYYFLLHFWMPVFGMSEYAVRFLSVIAGVLTVAVTFRIAYLFFDEEVAIITAFLSAFSPFQVYYSQEARMYIWVTLWCTVSVLAMTVMLRHNSQIANSRSVRSLAWFICIIATIAALYTQYFGATIVIVENLAFAIWLFLTWRSRPVIASEAKQSPSPILEIASSQPFDSADSRLRSGSPLAMTDQPAVGSRRSAVGHTSAFWLAAQAIVGIATAPWYLSVREQLAAWPAISEPMDLLTLLWRVLNVFSAGMTVDAGTGAAIAIAFGVLFCIGWRRLADTNANWVTSTLILWSLVPVGAMYAISLSRPAYNPKLLLLATPPFFILAARGLSWIHPGIFLHRREGNIRTWSKSRLVWVLWTISVFAAVGFVPSLRNYYFDPQYARDDYRSILQFIDANARPGDGILVDDIGQIGVVRYYHRGDQQLFLLPRMRPADPTATRADVDDMLSKTKRLFAIYYATQQSDPDGIIETRLAEKAFKARDEWHGNVRSVIYGVAPAVRGEPKASDAKFGDQITLARFQLDQNEARAGDVLTLTLNWRADEKPNGRYKVFVHLLNANNQVIAQRDGEPVSDTRITTTWHASETIADNYGIFLEPGITAGEYQIEIGMYRAEDGARLRVGESDHLILGTVKIK